MDDCWQVTRDAQGIIQADPKAFPSGVPALADYVHSRKLKFGLYSGITLSARLSGMHRFFLRVEQMLDLRRVEVDLDRWATK